MTTYLPSISNGNVNRPGIKANSSISRIQILNRNSPGGRSTHISAALNKNMKTKRNNLNFLLNSKRSDNSQV